MSLLKLSVVRKKNDKHREWLREKQIRDIEEIIPTLNTFLNGVSDCLEAIEAHQRFAYDDVRNLAEAKRYHAESVNVRFLQEFSEGYTEDSNALWQLNTKSKAWFGFEAKRLSIWFDEADEIEQRLEDIGKQIFVFHLVIHRTSSAFRWLVDKIIYAKGEVTDADLSEARKLRDDFFGAANNWPGINEFVLEFQKTLADKYKPARYENHPNPDNDGLLVQIARWTEKKLRWLLRLG